MQILVGCVSGPADAQPGAGQLMIKFSDGIDPQAPGYLTSLSAQTGHTLIYVRPLSGGAHVLRVEQPLSEGQWQALLQKLTRQPDVVYAERDRTVRHYSY